MRLNGLKITLYSCFCFLVFFSFSSFAETNDIGNLGERLCTLVSAIVEGRFGKAIGMIAVIALGIGIFLGKLSWGLALATVVGIVLIFSSGSIVNTIGGLDGSLTCGEGYMRRL